MDPLGFCLQIERAANQLSDATDAKFKAGSRSQSLEGFLKGILKGSLKGFLKGILKGVLKGIRNGILEGAPKRDP